MKDSGNNFFNNFLKNMIKLIWLTTVSSFYILCTNSYMKLFPIEVC